MSRLTLLGKLTKWMVHNPALDTLRLDMLTLGSHHGMNFLSNSYRTIRVIAPGAQSYIDGTSLKRPAIYAIFHGRMVGLLGLQPRRQVTILVSDSRDGEIVSRALLSIGFSIARGSIKRKAVQGAKALVDAARQGQSIAFMVDGPRGPAHEIKPGLIRLAEITQLPIIPFVCRSRSNWWFPSWDKFMGSLWSTPTIHVFGEPVTVPAGASEADRKHLLASLQSSMDSMREEAERLWR